MEDENKLVAFFKKLTNSEKALQLVPFYFFMICVLLFVMIFKISETNKYLKEIAENGTEAYVHQADSSNQGLVTGMFFENPDETEYEAESDYIADTEYYTNFYSEVESENTNSNEEVKTQSHTEKATEKTTKSTSNNEKSTGKATTTQKASGGTQNNNQSGKVTYVINKNSKKIHYSSCSFVDRMKDENKMTVKLTKEELNEYLKNGYTFCSTCGG